MDQSCFASSLVNLANLVRLRTIEFYETHGLVSDKQCDCLA